MSLFLLFSFLSFFFLSFLSFYFSFFYLRKYLSPLIHLRLMKQIFSVSFLPFLNIYIYIYIYNFKYLGRVEGKTILSCTYLFEGFTSFTGERHFSRIWLKMPFCYLLSKDSILLFPGAWLTWSPPLAMDRPWQEVDTKSAKLCPELKKRVLFFGAKGLGQSFGLFLPPLYFIQSCDSMTCTPFSIQLTTGHGVLAAFDLHSDCISGQSLGLVSSNTEGRGILSYFPSPGGIPHHSMKLILLEEFNYCWGYLE